METNQEDVGYRIRNWAELYEPPGRDRPEGPLSYVRWHVYGHSQSESYRLLFSLAPPAIAAAAFGLFGKLLELAGDEPAELRDGTIRWRNRPSTLRTLTVQTLYPPDLLAQCLALLAHQDIHWIETMPPGSARAQRPSAGRRLTNGRPTAKPRDRRTNTESETDKKTHTNTETDTPGATTPITSPSPSRPPPATQPDSLSADRQRAAARSAADVCAILRPRTPTDVTTIHRAISHALSLQTNPEAINDAANHLKQLAVEKKTSATARNPRAVWTSAVIRHYGPWNGKTEQT